MFRNLFRTEEGLERGRERKQRKRLGEKEYIEEGPLVA